MQRTGWSRTPHNTKRGFEIIDSKNDLEYVPGLYAGKKASASDLADRYIREWDEDQQKIEREDIMSEKLFPAICFSRIIGVGAVEIADIFAKKIGYRVVDRLILEHIINEIKLSNRTTSVLINVIQEK